MIIDARKGELHELFIKLREIFTSGMNDSIEILLNSVSDVKKVKTFASMSGCKIELKDKDGYYVLRVTDCCSSCG